MAKLVIKKNTINLALGGFKKKIRVSANRAVNRNAKRVRAFVLPLTPKESGTLRGDFFVNPATDSNKQSKATVGFSGASDAHAAAHHEGPRSAVAPPSWDGVATLDYTTAGTGPKFLERGLIAFAKGYREGLRKALKSQLAARFRRRG